MKLPLVFFVFTAVTLNSLSALEWDRTSVAAVATDSGMEATFLATNRHSFPVLIIKMEPDCNCTKVRLQKELLAPGETVELHASAALNGQSGFVEKKITVFSDDAPDRPATLAFAITVTQRIALQPRALRWLGGARGEKIMTVSGASGGTVVKLDYDHTRFAVTKARAGAGWEIRVRPLAATAGRASLKATFLTLEERVVRLEADLEIIPDALLSP